MFFGSQAFAILTAIKLRHGVSVCIGKEKPLAQQAFCIFSSSHLINYHRFKLTAKQLSFQLFLLILTIYNAMHRPRRSNGELIKRLEEDGAKYFFALIAIQTIYLIMSVSGNSANVLLFLFIFWSLGSIIISRLHFCMEELSIENSKEMLLLMDTPAQVSRRRSVYKFYT
ncbi:hypothetical protein BDQ17DRAFT_1368292 [Cyathus striatus]|nr:hypothetical protein BDQ17DRAFT_1368292 [Cyathus striatus]